MTEDGFGLDDIIEFMADLLPPQFGGLPDTPLTGGDDPLPEDADALMADQARRIPELQEPQPDPEAQPAEPAQPSDEKPPTAEEQEALVEAQRDTQKMAETLNEISSTRHQTAMGIINNMR